MLLLHMVSYLCSRALKRAWLFLPPWRECWLLLRWDTYCSAWPAKAWFWSFVRISIGWYYIWIVLVLTWMPEVFSGPHFFFFFLPCMTRTVISPSTGELWDVYSAHSPPSPCFLCSQMNEGLGVVIPSKIFGQDPKGASRRFLQLLCLTSLHFCTWEIWAFSAACIPFSVSSVPPRVLWALPML